MTTTQTISPELLEILRCPYCVSGETRMSGDDPGQLELVQDGQWLYSKESGYKYPIKEGIPVMLIEEGRKWKDTPVEELPDPGLLVEPEESSEVSEASFNVPQAASGPDPKLFLAAIGGVVVVGLTLIVIFSRRKD